MNKAIHDEDHNNLSYRLIDQQADLTNQVGIHLNTYDPDRHDSTI